VYEEDVKRIGPGANGRMGHIGENRVCRTGIEEEAKASDEKEEPDRWKRRAQSGDHEGESEQHRQA